MTGKWNDHRVPFEKKGIKIIEPWKRIIKDFLKKPVDNHHLFVRNDLRRLS